MARALATQRSRLPYDMTSADQGQGLVEYALIIAPVAIVVIAALVLLGPTIAGIFTNINNSL
jgi:pilus assembly protein Flp/PilA